MEANASEYKRSWNKNTWNKILAVDACTVPVNMSSIEIYAQSR